MAVSAVIDISQAACSEAGQLAGEGLKGHELTLGAACSGPGEAGLEGTSAGKEVLGAGCCGLGCALCVRTCMCVCVHSMTALVCESTFAFVYIWACVAECT